MDSARPRYSCGNQAIVNSGGQETDLARRVGTTFCSKAVDARALLEQ
jgi:hypothetical protein